MQPPGAKLIHITIPPPAPPPSPWVVWTIGAALLAGAAVLAHQRVLSGTGTPPRLWRIVRTGFAAAVALALLEAPRDLMEAIPEFGVRLAVRLIFFTALFSVLYGALDLLLDALKPTRARPWLVAGIPLFAALLPVAIGAADLWEWTPMFEEGGPGAAAVAGAVAGLAWWSCLPMRNARLTSIFE